MMTKDQLKTYTYSIIYNKQKLSLAEINRLFKKLYNKRIFRLDVTLLLNHWVLYLNGYQSKPKYFPNQNNEYIRVY